VVDGCPQDLGYYALVQKRAIGLRSAAFMVYAQVCKAANFRTGIADLRYLRWKLRRWRSKRQINRILAQLCPTLLRKLGPYSYKPSRGAPRGHKRTRCPVRFWVLSHAQDPTTALITRFLLFLAWQRIPLSWIRPANIANALQCDRTTAHALWRWWQDIGQHRYTKEQIRRCVFYSRVSHLRRYIPDRSDPRGRYAQCRPAARSGNDPPKRSGYIESLKDVLEKLTGSGHTQPARGGRPDSWQFARKRQGGTFADRAAADRHFASCQASKALRCGGAPPAPPGQGTGAGGAQSPAHGPRVTAEQLIGWMGDSSSRSALSRRLAVLKAKSHAS